MLSVRPERKDIIMKRILPYLLLIVLLTTPVAALSEDRIPNASLRVTVQQKEEGRITKGFHVLELSCFDGNCSLSSVFSTMHRNWFWQKGILSGVQFGNMDCNLKVRSEGKSLVVQETGSDMFGDYEQPPV